MPFILIGPVPLAWLWRREAPLTHRDLALLATLMIMLALALTMVPKRFNCYLIPVFPANDVLAAGGILRQYARRSMHCHGCCVAVAYSPTASH